MIGSCIVFEDPGLDLAYFLSYYYLLLLYSSIRFITSIAIRKPLLRPIKSASVVLITISVWFLEDPVNEQPANIRSLSTSAVALLNFLKAAFHHSSRVDVSGSIDNPMSHSFMRYLQIFCLWVVLGCAANLAHSCTAYAMSGTDDFLRKFSCPIIIL